MYSKSTVISTQELCSFPDLVLLAIREGISIVQPTASVSAGSVAPIALAA